MLLIIFNQLSDLYWTAIIGPLIYTVYKFIMHGWNNSI